MKPYYTDLHIHTSENPDDINSNYDVMKLIEKIEKYSNTSNILISLTDHNVINKKAYLDLEKNGINYIVGVELHIKIEGGQKPYHCHIYFDTDKKYLEEEIDDINDKLKLLYPQKKINEQSKIPNLEEIISQFDKYDFMLLPHAGQSHSPFNKAIPKNKRIDSTMQSVIYYNFFDGFTSRNIKGKNSTKEYFKKLGIDGFVNLITCSDNYDPINYPDTKADSDLFIPTWIMAEPSFLGLRLSLSEESRLYYQKNEPEITNEYIKKIKLENDKIDIDVDLTPGLNVIIGGSSTGKTLLVDSICRKIRKDDFTDSIYTDYRVSEIQVDNPSSSFPHYINQNYISNILSSNEEGIGKIDVLKYLFPNTSDLEKEVDNELFKLKKTISDFVAALEKIENSKNKIMSIPAFPRLTTKSTIKSNPFTKLKPTKKNDNDVDVGNSEVKRFEDTLFQIKTFSKQNVLMNNVDEHIDAIINELSSFKQKKVIYNRLKELLESEEETFNRLETTGKEEDKKNEELKHTLLNEIGNYVKAKEDLNKELINLHEFNFKCETKVIESKGHRLFIENNFVLNKKVILDEINNLINTRIDTFNEISETNINTQTLKKKSPKVNGYEDFNKKLYDRIAEKNKKHYKIITSDGKDFDTLSPGWKTAIILDIIFGYKKDNAPIIIDQPEDNLASNYINDELINSIKNCKKDHQIIIVTHNATIPMLADAQNIVLCRRDEGMIKIQSCPLEGKINEKTAIDYVANITDGGKTAIKKRYKKYNIKKYREETSR